MTKDFFVSKRCPIRLAEPADRLCYGRLQPLGARSHILVQNEAGLRQGELAGEREAEEQSKEEAYLATILLQRDQEIRQLIIKRNALVPKSLQKRKAEKEAKKAKQITFADTVKK